MKPYEKDYQLILSFVWKLELMKFLLLLAEIVQVHVAERYFMPSGAIDEGAMNLVTYVHGKYRALADVLGFFGYSVASDDALKRRTAEQTRPTAPSAANTGA